MARVVIFAPSPMLTVTIEDNPHGPEVHVHAGGQGVWQARMLRRLGIETTLCCALIGETGEVVGHLLEHDGIRVASVPVSGRGAAYVHDRRGGERKPLVETPGDPLSRHDLDDLYSLTVGAAIDANLALLSGPMGDDVLPNDVYRRLAMDLREEGTPVVADLAGLRMHACLQAGIRFAKMSDEEMLANGLIDSADPAAIRGAMLKIVRMPANGRQPAGVHDNGEHDDSVRGAQAMIVARAERPAILCDRGKFYEVSAPVMQPVDTRGAGDSLTAGVAACLAKGETVVEAARFGAAAGALNVTRRGLGSGDVDAIMRMRTKVHVRSIS